MSAHYASRPRVEGREHQGADEPEHHAVRADEPSHLSRPRTLVCADPRQVPVHRRADGEESRRHLDVHHSRRGEGHDAPLKHERSKRLLSRPRRVVVRALDVRTSRVHTRPQRRQRQQKVWQLFRRVIAEESDVPVVILHEGVHVRERPPRRAPRPRVRSVVPVRVPSTEAERAVPHPLKPQRRRQNREAASQKHNRRRRQTFGPSHPFSPLHPRNRALVAVNIPTILFFLAPKPSHLSQRRCEHRAPKVEREVNQVEHPVRTREGRESERDARGVLPRPGQQQAPGER
mmetsp:Transcript_8441/g.34067  ORF Transcript_8441/g.34067 Transcript_8441/m.34067 type:complete len:289 (-) Transcript_8441:497-1363(-)